MLHLQFIDVLKKNDITIATMKLQLTQKTTSNPIYFSAKKIFLRQ